MHFTFTVSMEMNRAIYIHEVLCSHILRFFCSSFLTGSSGEFTVSYSQQVINPVVVFWFLSVSTVPTGGYKCGKNCISVWTRYSLIEGIQRTQRKMGQLLIHP